MNDALLLTRVWRESKTRKKQAGPGSNSVNEGDRRPKTREEERGRMLDINVELRETGGTTIKKNVFSGQGGL